MPEDDDPSLWSEVLDTYDDVPDDPPTPIERTIYIIVSVAILLALAFVVGNILHDALPPK